MAGGLSPLGNAASAGVDSVLDPGALERKAKSDDPESVRAAAREFESLFLHQLFKSMRATVPKEGLMDPGMGGEMFTDMLDMEYAKNAADTGGIGLADLVAQQFGVAGGPAPGGQRDAAAPLGAAGSRAVAQARGLSAYGASSPPAEMTQPVAGGRISSEFGMRQLKDDAAPRMHDGLDIAAPTGTPIRAALDGKVTYAGWIKGYGNSVIVDHGEGTTTLYGHASELLVEKGDEIARGAPIARVGSTGHSTGPHLHFEVRRDGQAVDPRPALKLR